MSDTQQNDEIEYRKLISQNRITVPERFRGDEVGYHIEQADDGRIILHPHFLQTDN